MIAKKGFYFNKTIYNELLSDCLEVHQLCLQSKESPGGSNYIRGVITTNSQLQNSLIEVKIPRQYEKAGGGKRKAVYPGSWIVPHHQCARCFIYLVLYCHLCHRDSLSDNATVESQCRCADISITTLYRWIKTFKDDLTAWIREFLQTFKNRLFKRLCEALKAQMGRIRHKTEMAVPESSDYPCSCQEAAAFQS